MLSQAQLRRVFPFYLRIDRQLRIDDFGPSVARALPALESGTNVLDAFTFARPRLRPFDFDSLAARREKLWVLYSKDGPLRLRGEAILLEDSDTLLLLCSPWLESVVELQELGLTLDDFAAHDSVAEAMFLVKARDLSLADAKRLASEAAAANLAKDTFLANLSHELRTPMNGVLGMAEVLLEDLTDDAHQDAIRTIADSARALLEILNDLLDLSKLKERTIEIREQTCELRRIAHDIVALHEDRARTKDLCLTLDVASEIPQFVRSDPTRIRQVLNNLVTNAIKFTEKGRIDVDIAPDGDGKMRFRVRDTGIGIAPEQLEQVFEPFTQVDASSRRRFEGAGLGLSISRHLVAALGGDLVVESEFGIGSCFSFALDLAAVEQTDAEPSDRSTPAFDARVLLAEDNEINAKVATRILTRLGCRVEHVTDGREAVASVAGGGFDLVLMDCRMPTMDGLEAAREIRQLPGAFADVPIVAFTANVFGQDHADCMEAGMNDFLGKPATPRKVAAVLARWLGDCQRQPATSSA